jgi:Tfp pilus assembly protein PilN
MPRVNLLPPEIAAAAKLKRLKAILALILLAVMVVVALGYLVVSSQVGSAEEDLAAVQAEAATLQAEKATYAEVPQVYAAVNTAQQNLATAMAPEIRWSFYLNDLSLTIPKSTRLTGMTAVNDAAAAQLSGDLSVAEGGVVTPLGYPTMGSISFSGKSEDFDAVASWLQSLARQNGYLEPYVQNIAKADAQDAKGTWYDVESNTQLSPDAASMRFEQIANGE